MDTLINLNKNFENIKCCNDKDGKPKNGMYQDQLETKRWYKDGLRHRKDGPAIEWKDGTEKWWFEGKRHRADGPAIKKSGGYEEWWFHGKKHRDDGPAIIFCNGEKEYWIEGCQYTEEEFNILAQKKLLNENLPKINEKKKIKV